MMAISIWNLLLSTAWAPPSSGLKILTATSWTSSLYALYTCQQQLHPQQMVDAHRNDAHSGPTASAAATCPALALNMFDCRYRGLLSLMVLLACGARPDIA